MSMTTHLVLHGVFHAAAMGLMALPAMAAMGVAMTPANVATATVDMTVDVFEGLAHVFDISSAAEGVAYPEGGLHGGHHVPEPKGAPILSDTAKQLLEVE